MTLTRLQQHVLDAMAGGARDIDIAAELFVSTSTVRRHIVDLRNRLGARNRTEAVAIGFRKGLLR
jgi:DNA-binding NarL/FixJ family response regulator